MALITTTTPALSPGNIIAAGRPDPFRVLRHVGSGPMGRFALICVAAMLLCAIFAPWLAPHDPIAIKAALRLKGPSMDYWLGNDQLGRDVL